MGRWGVDPPNLKILYDKPSALGCFTTSSFKIKVEISSSSKQLKTVLAN